MKIEDFYNLIIDFDKDILQHIVANNVVELEYLSKDNEFIRTDNLNVTILRQRTTIVVDDYLLLRRAMLIGHTIKCKGTVDTKSFQYTVSSSNPNVVFTYPFKYYDIIKIPNFKFGDFLVDDLDDVFVVTDTIDGNIIVNDSSGERFENKSALVRWTPIIGDTVVVTSNGIMSIVVWSEEFDNLKDIKPYPYGFDVELYK